MEEIFWVVLEDIFWVVLEDIFSVVPEEIFWAESEDIFLVVLEDIFSRLPRRPESWESERWARDLTDISGHVLEDIFGNICEDVVVDMSCPPVFSHFWSRFCLLFGVFGPVSASFWPFCTFFWLSWEFSPGRDSNPSSMSLVDFFLPRKGGSQAHFGPEVDFRVSWTPPRARFLLQYAFCDFFHAQGSLKNGFLMKNCAQGPQPAPRPCHTGGFQAFLILPYAQKWWKMWKIKFLTCCLGA